MLNIHKPFHQKYRPNKLDELVGQEFVSITLKQALISQKIAPAYLFNGPRGTGKTSSARIFAKSLNCISAEEPTIHPCGHCDLCKEITDGIALDIIEIDAASNTGVENIREIIDRARFAPTKARWKVYVIDECHMLSTAASNALLKTIEEPPPKVVFILATTNPERVLRTIHSRCQKFDFKRINAKAIFEQLSKISIKESIKYEDKALKLIAKRSNGGMRDAQSLLDQLSLLPEGITLKNVQNLLGEVAETDLIRLIESIIFNNPESLIINCNKLYDAGNEPYQILVGLLNITRDLLLKTLNNNYSEIYYTSIDFQNQLDNFSKNLNKSRIIDWHNKLRSIEYHIKTSDNPRLWLEINLTSLLEKNNLENIPQINKSKTKLEPTYEDMNIQRETVKVNNKEDINKETLPSQDENMNIQRESVKINYKEDIDKEALPSQDENFDNNNILKEKWELILSKLELPSTKMLLSQQAELVSVTSNEVLIALSPNWENMIKTRQTIIETAVKKVFGDQIKLNFSSKKTRTTNFKREYTDNIVKNQLKQSTSLQNSNLNPENINSETSDKNSPKNLANFFNGEIIDLEE